MATFHDRTVAPKFQRGLLRSVGSPCRVLTSAEVIDLVEATKPVSAHFGENPVLATMLHDGAECADTLAVGISRGDIPTLEVPRSGERKIAPNDLRNLAQKPVQHEPVSDQPADPDTAAQARALHMRRELHQALDYGFALLDALDLSPRGLDIIDGAIARLDAMDAPDEDMEPSLSWTESGPRFCGDYQDCELDTADCEPDLATPEHHPEVSHCSAPWSYVDSSPDSSQLRWAQGAQHDGEVVNEDGDELDVGEHDETDKEPSIGWPNDYKAVLSPVLMADHDPEEVNEDGDDCGEAHASWWDRIGYTTTEGVHV